MKRFRFTSPYRSESSLCARFAEVARQSGFLVFPETGDCDLLLVAGENCRGFKPGDQIGIQAKMRPNVMVLAQSLPRPPRVKGPNYYAVLVPSHPPDEFDTIATELKITVLSGGAMDNPTHPFVFTQYRWWRFEPLDRLWVPDCQVPSMPAGVPAPRQLTQWKMQAIRLCLHGERQGYLTSEDFKTFDVSMTRWVKLGWIKAGACILSKGRWRYLYTLNHEKQPPHVKHREVAEALAQELACTA